MAVDLAQAFSQEVRNSLRLFGAWPPGEIKALGTYGVLKGAWFRPIGHVTTDFGFAVEPQPIGPKLQFDFKSSGASEAMIDAHASGRPAPGAAAKVRTKLAFKHAGSSYFRTKNATYRTIANLDEVNRNIMQAFKEGRWRGDFALIHGLFEAEATTIIISSNDDAEIELEGTATPGGALDLADAHAGVKYKSDRDIATKILCGARLTPLFCLSRLTPKNRFLNLLGMSEKYVLPLLQGDAAEASGMAGSDNMVTQLTPDVSVESAADLKSDPDSLFQMTEIEA